MLGKDCYARCIPLTGVSFPYAPRPKTQRTTPKLLDVPLIAATTAMRKMKMKTHSFTIIASGLDPNASDFEDRFFEAGCDDATISFQKGVILLEFDREAKNFSHALASAMRDVEAAGARVEHVEPDHLVSLTDIAVRAGVTRSAASMYAQGKRGKNFPAPVARVTTESALWDWLHVARWLYQHRRISFDEVLSARLVRAANEDMRNRRGRERTLIQTTRCASVTVITGGAAER